MTSASKFASRSKLLQNIFLILFLALSMKFIFTIGYVIWEASPLSEGTNYHISFPSDKDGNRLYTVIGTEKFQGLIQLDRSLMSPTEGFIVSKKQAVIHLVLIGSVYELPILIALWWAMTIFKYLSMSQTPFDSDLFKRIKNLGKLFILYGLFGKLIFSLLITVFVTGTVCIINPIDFNKIILGFVLYAALEIMVYGFGLQSEVDTLL